MNDLSWYALSTKAGWESKAHADLSRFGVQAWLPRSKIRTVRKTKSGPVIRWPEVPHYPRYLFAHLPTNRLWLARKAKCSIVSLEEEGYPSPIPDHVMQILMAGADLTGLMLPKAKAARARFQAMQRVRITDELSAFYDKLGEVLLDDGQDQVTVILRLVGKDCPLKINHADLVAA